MAVTEIVKKHVASMALENGTDDYGNMKYVTQSFGTLSKDGWDADKIMNIKDGVAPILSKTVGYVQSVTTAELIRQS